MLPIHRGGRGGVECGQERLPVSVRRLYGADGASLWGRRREARVRRVGVVDLVFAPTACRAHARGLGDDMAGPFISPWPTRASCRRQFQASPRPPTLSSHTRQLRAQLSRLRTLSSLLRSLSIFCPSARKELFWYTAPDTPSFIPTTTPPTPRSSWPDGRWRHGEPAAADHRHYLLYEEEAPAWERLYVLRHLRTGIVLGLTYAADLDEADSPFANYRQDLKRKSQYARASDPDFLSDPRPYKKVR